MTASYVERVGARASEVKIGRALLSVLAAPFYVIGFVVGVLLAGFVWCWAAAQIGVGDAKRLRKPVTDDAR